MKSTKPTSQVFLRRLSTACAALVLILTLAAAWLAVRANEVQTHLSEAAALLPSLLEQVEAGDSDSAQGTLAAVRQHVAEGHAAGTDPVWRAASLLPFFGPNFRAVTEVTVAADDVINRAATPLLAQLDTIAWRELISTDGRVDVGAISDLAPELSTAHATVDQSHRRLAAIDENALIPQVVEPLTKASAALSEVSTTLSHASSLANLLPGMLGANEPRSYLLLIQNSAEIRATGGIPGALAVVQTTDGRIALVEQTSASEIGEFEPALAVEPEQTLIYSDRMGRFMQSANLTPEFPTVAKTTMRMWEQRNNGEPLDGVIALDVVALSNILRATGPVELKFEDQQLSDRFSASGLPSSLTSDNVVSTLLSDVYAAIEEPALQDAYFAAVAGEIFDALAAGGGESADLVQALARSTNEGRLYVWSAAAEEQDIIAASPLAGSVTGTGSGGASFGAYFNDGTGAKMDYYVKRTVRLQRSCTPEGYRQYTLTTTLSNSAPSDAARSLPRYVTGGGESGVPPGTIQTNFVGYGPQQALLQKARINGEAVQVGSFRHGDRPVGLLTTSLRPGETATVELDFTNVAQQSEPTLDVTPTIQQLEDVLLPLKSDDSCKQ
ncbi:DUF4012 domain-containing protein [uncultured Arthrobacter sp.]|uniref:DUF4012 domain-containing protein n=1 Tax=uncultured Arthrobacter sp. TaxID=114050 RepID=UPI0026081F37|nr:DUF4012 domain-containing protein [uncultured Arthrobacter sp.]